MFDWSGAAVDPDGGKPTPEEWAPVDLPGRPAAFAGEDRVAYRTTFADPRDPDEAMACLHLDGVYDGGTVWLNGDRVAEPDSVLGPVHVPFEPDPENELVVACRAPDDRYGGIHDTDRVPENAAVPGIWWTVEMTTHPETFIVDVEALAQVTDEGGAIQAGVEVFSREGGEVSVTLTTRPAGESRGRGMMDRTGVVVAPGDRATAAQTVELRDPSLWWPRGVGPQNRYEVRAKLDDEVVAATTGLATVTETDEGLAVNGQQVPVRGVTLQDGTVADVERALEVNANLVRAHAHVLSPAVYEACDEAGVLVWQDLPLTGPGEFDVERGRELTKRLATTRGNHPSLAAVSVHDEPTELFADRLGSGPLTRLRFYWRLWRGEYDTGPARRVAAAFPVNRVDRPVYPVVGEPGSDPDAAALYPGWDYGTVDDLAWVHGRYGPAGVVAEFGAGALGVADPRETAGFDRAKHDAVVEGDGVEASQRYQATLVRSIAERLRADGAGIVVANALRDTSDAGMGVYGRDGDPKAAATALATAFEPVAVVLPDPGPGESDAVVVNDTPNDVEGTVAWEAGEASGEFAVAVDAAGRQTAGTVAVPGDAETVTLTLTVEGETVRTEYRL